MEGLERYIQRRRITDRENKQKKELTRRNYGYKRKHEEERYCKERKRKKNEESRCKLRKKSEVSNLLNVVSLIVVDILHTMSASVEAS